MINMGGWAGGSTSAWRRVRAEVLARDRHRCRAHLDGWCAKAVRKTSHVCTNYATHAHHVRGRRATGDDPAFIVAACAACNLYIGDPTEGGDPPCKPMTQW